MKSVAIRSSSQLFEHPLLSFLAWLILPLVAAFLFGQQVEDVYKRPYFLGFGTTIALVISLIVSLNWGTLQASLAARPLRISSLPLGWCLVCLAIALRLALLQFIPPPLPGFEEMQTGGAAITIARGAELPLVFRFTNVFGALGFALGDNSLAALRVGFQLAGSLSILVMALLLRRCGVSWIPTLLAVLTMATLRLLVIGGGSADELFTGVVFEVFLLYCVVGSQTSRANWLPWAGFAGLFAGLLAYEYDSYRVVLVLPPVFWLVQAITAGEVADRRRALQAGGLYVLVFTAIALPVIASVIDDPRHTMFMDGFHRHRAQRDAFAPDVASYLKRSSAFVWGYVQSLIGQVDNHSSSYLRPPGESVIPAVVGALFALSWLYALWRPANLLMRLSALTVLVMLLGASFLTNNTNLARLIPALPLLIVLTAMGADSILRRLQSRDNPGLLRKTNIYAALLIAYIVIGNITAALRFYSSESVLREYGNNQYTVCRAITDEHRHFRYVISYVAAHCNRGDDQWLYPDMRVTMEHRASLTGESDLPAGSLVMIGDSNGLPEDRIAEFVEMANRLNSAHTLRTTETALGKVATVTFCFKCSQP